MKRLPIVIIACVVLIFVGYFFLLSKSSPTPYSPNSEEISSKTHIYFWSESCPHCKNVAAFLDTWQNKEKISLDKKEISTNKDNAELLAQKAAACNIPVEQVGVPLLVTPEGKCFNGDQPIISYFQSMTLESTRSGETATTSANIN